MQRSKQQAMMFLLGAVLVGGVLGASGYRVYQHAQFADQYLTRREFYNSLGLSAEQRAKLDSIQFVNECDVKAALLPVKPRLDSIRSNFNAQMNRVYTADQLKKVEQRRAEIKTKREAEQAQEPKRTCSAKS